MAASFFGIRAHFGMGPLPEIEGIPAGTSVKIRQRSTRFTLVFVRTADGARVSAHNLVSLSGRDKGPWTLSEPLGLNIRRKPATQNPKP